MGINFAVDGSTTKSFVQKGYWAEVLAAIAQYKGSYDTIVTIQFGHNDQKYASGITIDEFITNLEGLAADVVAAGATPIIVTSLTRRNFNSSTVPELIEKDLFNVTVAAKIAAERGNYHLIDLNQASMDYCNAIGPLAANTYDLAWTGKTHINDQGSIVFGAIVAELPHWQFPWLYKFIFIQSDLSLAIKESTYFWPVVLNRTLTTGANSTGPVNLADPGTQPE